MQVHSHVDGGLQAEQDCKAGSCKADERIFRMQRMTQRTDHDKGKQREQKQAQDDAELLRRHREDEVGVTLRQDALHRALTRTTPGPAAACERFHREIDVKGITRCRIHETLDASRLASGVYTLKQDDVLSLLIADEVLPLEQLDLEFFEVCHFNSVQTNKPNQSTYKPLRSREATR